VSAVIIETLNDLKLSYPDVDPERRKGLAAARSSLEKKKD
jgi:hypothetical protein